jgi:hypothetical protein
MNARIQHLMDRSFTDEQGERFDPERFAELIVKECARACLATTDPGSSIHLVSVAYADAVRQHFGVEE